MVYYLKLSNNICSKTTQFYSIFNLTNYSRSTKDIAARDMTYKTNFTGKTSFNISIKSMSCISHGLQLTYSRNGRTYVLNARMNLATL